MFLPVEVNIHIKKYIIFQVKILHCLNALWKNENLASDERIKMDTLNIGLPLVELLIFRSTCLGS